MAVRGLSMERDEVQKTDDRPAGGPQPVLKVGAEWLVRGSSPHAKNSCP